MVERDGQRHLVIEAAGQARHLARKHAYWSVQVQDQEAAGLLRRLADGEERLAGELQRWLEWLPGLIG